MIRILEIPIQIVTEEIKGIISRIRSLRAAIF